MHLRARTSPNSQAVSKLFPLSVLGMSDTLYPPQKKNSIKNKLTMATEREVGLSDWACVSNLSGRKQEIPSALCLLSLFSRLCPSTVLSTEPRVSAVTHFRPTINHLVVCRGSFDFVVICSSSVCATYLLFGFNSRDGREQTVDAVPPYPLPASAAY